MRMWLVEPKKMCRNHLLGEHKEIHMMIGAIRKNKNIQGFLNGLYDLKKIAYRHMVLVMEMTNRGYNHKSDISREDCNIVKNFIKNNGSGRVDIKKSYEDLRNKCDKCEFKNAIL